MQQIEVLSFHPSAEPLFRVVYTPSGKKRRRELLVVGAVLSKITGLDCFTPFTTYRLASGGTSKAAMRGQSKTGHVLKGIRDEIVLLCRLLRKQVCFCTPATRTAFEYMSVVQQAVEHGGDGRTVA